MPVTTPERRPTRTIPPTRTPNPRDLAGWASLAGRLTLAAVLLIASLGKIADPAATVRAVRAYEILPNGLASVVGHALPSVELAVAALLLVGLAVRATAALTALLLAVFVAGIVSADVRGLSIDCGCFGGGGATAHPHYAGEIARDLVLLAVAVGVAVTRRSALALDPALPLVAAAPTSSGRQAKVAQVRAQERAAEVRTIGRRNVLIAAGAVVVVGVVGGVASRPTVTAVVLSPPGTTAAGGILVGSSSAKHHLVLFEDPQCPICGEFEKTSGATVQAAVANGTLQVEYRMRSFLGVESRRADAALGAAQVGGKFEALREALFANQPEEKTGGFTIPTLISLGAGVGLTDASYVSAVTNQTYAPWADVVDDQASKDGDTGTPKLVLDGKVVDNSVAFVPSQLAALLA